METATTSRSRLVDFENGGDTSSRVEASRVIADRSSDRATPAELKMDGIMDVTAADDPKLRRA